MTIIVLKLKRTSKCFPKLLEVLSKADHMFHPAPNDRNHHSTLWLLPQLLIVSHKHAPFNKTETEISNTSGARGDTKCYMSTAKSGNNARNFNMQVSSKQTATA